MCDLGFTYSVITNISPRKLIYTANALTLFVSFHMFPKLVLYTDLSDSHGVGRKHSTMTKARITPNTSFAIAASVSTVDAMQ